jgi:2-isopropylmalate synthase
MEITPQEVFEAFKAEYIDRENPYKLVDFRTGTAGAHQVKCYGEVEIRGQVHAIAGVGNGPIDAFVHALITAGAKPFDIISYSEHSLGQGADSRAAAYIQIKSATGYVGYGVGLDTNIELASILAIVSALNRAAAKGGA